MCSICIYNKETGKYYEDDIYISPYLYSLYDKEYLNIKDLDRKHSTDVLSFINGAIISLGKEGIVEKNILDIDMVNQHIVEQDDLTEQDIIQRNIINSGLVIKGRYRTIYKNVKNENNKNKNNKNENNKILKQRYLLTLNMLKYYCEKFEDGIWLIR